MPGARVGACLPLTRMYCLLWPVCLCVVCGGGGASRDCLRGVLSFVLIVECRYQSYILSRTGPGFQARLRCIIRASRVVYVWFVNNNDIIAEVWSLAASCEALRVYSATHAPQRTRRRRISSYKNTRRIGIRFCSSAVT